MEEEIEEVVEETSNEEIEITPLNLNEGNEENMSDEMKKIKRSKYASFLNVGTKEVPVWKRMGQGIAEMEVAYNAEEEAEKYIHQDSKTHNVTSYAPASDVTQKCYVNEPIFEYIDKKRRSRAVEDEAGTQILDVFIYDEMADGKYGAELNEAIIVVDSFSGDTIGYAVKRNGDPTEGVATLAENGTVTFTKS